MTIKTLTYIHNLLKEEKNKRLSDLHKARNCYKEAVDQEKEEDVITVCREIKNNHYEKDQEALDVLNDFEAKEW